MAIKPIPRNVKWTERNKKDKLTGKVIKEVQETENYSWGDFCRVIQVIRKDGEAEDLIRLGYYVKNAGFPDSKYMWGSQTTFITKRSTFDKLLQKAKKEGLLDF